MQKIKVGVFFGGVSPEHEVSITSAKGIIQNIDRNKFEVKQYYIDKQGCFFTGTNIIDKNLLKSTTGLIQVDLNTLNKEVDVAFPIIHGAGGEDGSIQGFLEALGIKYVGAGIMASAVSLDKGIFNQLLESFGIVKPRFVVLDNLLNSAQENKTASDMVLEDFNFPVFVKPARTGSSVGVYKVKEKAELKKYIEESMKFDNKVIIEEAVRNCREIEVSVLGNNKNNYEVSLPGEIKPGADFYDYNDKYKDNKTRFDLPAKLSDEKIKQIQLLAIKVYRLVNCEGLARVDFLLDENEKIFLNEINTLPGFTPISMYPKMWEVSGLPYRALITKLIELALSKK